MQEVALAGGAAREGQDAHFKVKDGVELQAALDAITAQLSCAVELSREPENKIDVLVRMHGEALNELSPCSEGEGFRWVNDAKRLAGRARGRSRSRRRPSLAHGAC